MWPEFFSVLVRERKIFRAKTKKISRHFFRIFRPQSELFRFVIDRGGRF
ncbi:DUF1661 domain-containing protein [Porphyromonas gulae]